MTFVQLVKFDESAEQAHYTNGERLLIKTDSIDQVAVASTPSEHKDEPTLKWLRVWFTGGGVVSFCPLDANGDAMKPKVARDHGDSSLLEWFQDAARRG